MLGIILEIYFHQILETQFILELFCDLMISLILLLLQVILLMLNLNMG